MKILFIFLQFGASISEPLSNTQLSLFWGIVLTLVVLFIYFLIRTNKIVDAKNQSTTPKETAKQNPNISAEIHEETAAAIALAIHMYQTDLHDQESFTITLKKVSKIYSPWSSKIYTLRQNPNNINSMKKFSFTINGNAYDLDIKSVEDNIAEVEVNGYSYTVEFDRVLETTKTPKLVRTEAVPSTDITRSEQKTSSPAGPKGTGFIKSPLPGTIIELHIKTGDTVRAGDKLLTLEAMKMENIINSDKSGTIISVNYKKGDAVMEGDILIEVG